MKNAVGTLILSCLIQASSCTKDKCCDVPPLGINITISNKNGEDLLDPKVKDALSLYDIDVHYLDGEVLEKQFHYPEIMQINLPSTNNRGVLSLHLSPRTNKENISTTILQYKNYPSDTITAQLANSNGNSFFRSVWVNGLLVMDKNGLLNPIDAPGVILAK